MAAAQVLDSRPRILLVEDEEDIRIPVRMILESARYAVDEAKHGREALAYLAHTTPSLVLLDLRMPIMDGWQLLEALQRDPRLASIPVVVMSATDVELSELNGARQLLPKPAEAVDILRVAAIWCRSETAAQARSLSSVAPRFAAQCAQQKI